MKICPKCGASLADGAKFCGKCGAPQSGAQAGSSAGQSGQRSASSAPSSGNGYPRAAGPSRPQQDPYARQPRQNQDSFPRGESFDRQGGSFDRTPQDRGYQNRGYQNNNYENRGYPGAQRAGQGDAFGGRAPQGRANQNYGYDRAPKRGKGKLIALIVALVAVIGAAAAAIVIFKPFGIDLTGKKGGKVETAVRSTMESVPIVSTLNTEDVVNKGKFTLSANITVQGVPLTASFSQDPGSKEQSLSFSATVEGETLSLKEYLDKNAVYLDPGAGTVFRYGYNENKTGALMTENPQAAAATQMIDTLLKLYTENMDGGAIEDDVVKKTEDSLRALPTTDLEKKDFEIDGKTQSLKGKSITITPADIKKIVNDVMASSTFNTLMGAVSTVSGGYNPLASGLDLSQLDQIGNIHLNVYDYKNRIGALEITFDNPQADGMVITVLFKGSQPFDNVVVSAKSNSQDLPNLAVITTEKTSGGTKVTLTVNSPHETLTFYARHENNKLSIGMVEPGGGEVDAITCGLAATKNSITISDINFNGSSYLLRQLDLEDLASIGTIQGSIELKSGANIQKVNTSGAVDIGNATMEQLNSITPDQFGLLAQLF